MDWYPHHENTYALIGNYLIEHGTAHSYFCLRLLGVSALAKRLSNYRWALMILLSKMEEASQFTLEEYDLTMSHIL
jgi:hypothetical protein